MIDYGTHRRVLDAQEHQLLSDSREFLEELREMALATCRKLARYGEGGNNAAAMIKNNQLVHHLDEEINRLDRGMRRHIRHD